MNTEIGNKDLKTTASPPIKCTNAGNKTQPTKVPTDTILVKSNNNVFADIHTFSLIKNRSGLTFTI